MSACFLILPERTQNNPYGKGKMDCELLCYKWGAQTGIDVISIIPEHVIGPLLCKAQDSGTVGV